jgi:anti-sigma regulatory factor (Ser/Thr protein kinase)
MPSARLADLLDLSNEVSVVIPIDFNIDETHKSTDALITRLQPLFKILGTQESACDSELTLDLSECRYFGPITVALLSLCVRSLRARQSRVAVIPPRHKKLRAYAEFSGFAALCWDGPTEDPNHHRNETSPLVFTSIRRSSDIERVVQLVQRHSTMSQDMIFALRTLLAELLMNIQDHAGAEGVITARWISKDKTVRVVIADLGMGLRRTLAAKYDVTSDQHAIDLALTERTTSNNRTHNFGNGLPLVRTLMSYNEGDLILASGNAILSYSGLHRPLRHQLDAGIALPGTLCALKFRIDHEIYDRDDDDDTDSVQW